MIYTEKDRHLPEYILGVDSFLRFAMSSGRITNIACPCVKCGNKEYLDKEDVRRHLIVYGIRKNYIFWNCHGEKRGRIEDNLR